MSDPGVGGQGGERSESERRARGAARAQRAPSASLGARLMGSVPHGGPGPCRWDNYDDLTAGLFCMQPC